MADMSRVAVSLLWLLIACKMVAVAARGPVPIELDAAGYWDLSSAVLDGDFWLLSEPIAYRTPMYPWLLAVIRAPAGSGALAWLAGVQGAIYLGTVYLAVALARLLTGQREAGWVTLLVSVPAIASLTFSTAVLTETVFTALLMANLLAMARYIDCPSAMRAGGVGVTFAFTLLTRPIVMFLWIVHLALAALAARRSPAKLSPVAAVGRRSVHWGHAALAASVVLAAVLPWAIRNERLFGEYFVTEFVGRNLWVVTFQDGSGAGLSLPPTQAAEELQRRLGSISASDQWRATWTVSRALTKSGLDDAAGDRLMKRVAGEAIARDPLPFIKKSVRRVVNFWRSAATDLPGPFGVVGPGPEFKSGAPVVHDPARFRNQVTWSWSFPGLAGWIEQRASRSVLLNTALMFLIGVATLLTIVRPSTRLAGLWMAAIFLYFSLVTGVFEIPAYRYRMVMEPLAATAIGCGWGAIRGGLVSVGSGREADITVADTA